MQILKMNQRLVMDTQKYIRARKDRKLAIIEGFHALKHALRFGAEIQEIITPDKGELVAMASRLAPHEAGQFEEAKEVNDEDFDEATPYRITTGVVAIAKRKHPDPKIILETDKPVVWLDKPRNHENIGAVIRLSAGLGLGAVVVTGSIDVWNPGVIRGATGLHYAIPVIKASDNPFGYNKPVFAFDDKGIELAGVSTPKNCIAVFGGERSGINEEIKERAEQVLALPMREGVSSYNLATSVSMAMYEIMRG